MTPRMVCNMVFLGFGVVDVASLTVRMGCNVATSPMGRGDRVGEVQPTSYRNSLVVNQFVVRRPVVGRHGVRAMGCGNVQCGKMLGAEWARLCARDFAPRALSARTNAKGERRLCRRRCPVCCSPAFLRTRRIGMHFVVPPLSSRSSSPMFAPKAPEEEPRPAECTEQRGNDGCGQVC